jgi:hypothetical protein
MSTTASNFALEPQPPKKRRHWRWMTGSILLVLLLGGASYSIYLNLPTPPQNNLPSPQNTLKAYCDAWTTGNAQEMYDLESTALQQHMNLIKVQQSIPRARPTACFVDEVKMFSSTTAAGDVFLRGGQYLSSDDDANLGVGLVLEQGAWKISDVGELV